jgi:undecaprenyl-diphosphatase
VKLLATIHRYDVSMFSWVMARKHRALFTRISRWISFTGDGYLYLAFGFLLFLDASPESRLLLTCALTAFAIERPVYFILKNGLKRNRPQDALRDFRSFIMPSDRFSFPSGHTSAAFLMATLLAGFYPSLAPLAFAWAAGVGLSRIFLGVHFPTDVLVGLTIGSGIALSALAGFGVQQVALG